MFSSIFVGGPFALVGAITMTSCRMISHPAAVLAPVPDGIFILIGFGKIQPVDLAMIKGAEFLFRFVKLGRSPFAVVECMLTALVAHGRGRWSGGLAI